jgi:predicted amidohydrolase
MGIWLLASFVCLSAVAEVEAQEVAARRTESVTGGREQEHLPARFRRVRVSVITLPWSEEGRTLKTVLDRLDEAGSADYSDIVCLPMECVKTDGEAIPGPISGALAEKAKQHRMYVIGNIRERDGGQVYVTSFLCDRGGQIVGKYRKSHKMPDEDMTLGDDLPVFDTDFGKIAMRVGSDRYFADIDHVYAAKGAGTIFWSQMPEPVEDEYLQDFPSAGRAQDYGVLVACSRYSFARDGWITNFYPTYLGCPIGRSYVINREGERIASTTRKGTVATAVVPASELAGGGRGPNKNPAFAALTEPVKLPPAKTWAKRKVRVTAIENHVGIEDLLQKLDQAGQLGSDLVCTYEFVWISGPNQQPQDIDRVTKQTTAAQENLRRIAAKAQQWKMYVVVAGVIDRLERNEAICYDRNGAEIGRYHKMIQTHAEQIVGTQTPVMETDFGRIGVKICADNALMEIDRSYAVKGADLVLFPTQDWGPDALFRNRREICRSMDGQLFLLEATHSTTEVMHRSVVVEPTGVPAASSQYRSNGLVSAVIDLDKDRPARFVRNFKPHTPGGYLPEYQSTQIPEERNDLKETILRQRRPELYQILAPENPKPSAARDAAGPKP